MNKPKDDSKKIKNEVIKYNDESHELPFLNPKKITQGQTKILRLVDDLIRNNLFLRSLKRIIRIQNKWQKQYEKGGYYEWTHEEQAEHDSSGDEAIKIIDEYEKLKKRAKKLVYKDDYNKIQRKIAWRYGLDSYLINLALARYKKDRHSVSNYLIEGGDMCRVHSDYNEEIMPLNKGDDFFKLNSRRELELIVYPASIRIHKNASKRDVLDFIEKNWWIIDMTLKEYGEKSYRARKRKYDQKMIDFIWANRYLPVKKLKEKIEVEFPKNGLVYYEIMKLIQLEKHKRFGYFEI